MRTYGMTLENDYTSDENDDDDDDDDDDDGVGLGS
jgi:hypothetical protein